MPPYRPCPACGQAPTPWASRAKVATVATALVLCVASGCRPPGSAERVVEPAAPFNRPIATVGPDDAVAGGADPATATPGTALPPAAAAPAVATPAVKPGCDQLPRARRCAPSPRP